MTFLLCSLSSYVQHERELTSAVSEEPVDRQNRELNQNYIAESCHHIDMREEVPACARKGVKVVKVYTCELCNKTFTYPSDLYVHTRIIHSKCRSSDCNVKVKNVSQPGQLYECTLCSRQFYLLKDFRRHSKSHTAPANADRQHDFSEGHFNHEDNFSKTNPEWKDFYFF
jgi:hypothetical protein